MLSAPPILARIQRIAAFSDGAAGGNPAGVLIDDVLPADDDMQRIAAELAYPETVFAAPAYGGWRVRYFSPEIEVPFCGHATIALGAALARSEGDGVFKLKTNHANISVQGRIAGNLVEAALQSPATASSRAEPELVDRALALFGYRQEDLDPRLATSRASAGATHLILPLRSRALLKAMRYNMEDGRRFMKRAGIITVMLIHIENPQRFHVRNAFAAGGVYEDPATGAATAALAGYLRDAGWPHGGAIEVLQGVDMGVPSRLRAEFSDTASESIRVSGTARAIVGESCADEPATP